MIDNHWATLPAPMNHEKTFWARPANMPLGSWYLTATKHYRLTILVKQK